MKLRSDKLKALMAERDVSAEDLAGAVERTGLEGPRSLSAVRSWMRGSDHPRCKASDLARMADALGAEPKDIARFVSCVRHHRGSPRKARLLADLIRGKSFKEAEELLTFNTKRAAVNMKKALLAAYADAEEQGVGPETLVVAESRVDEGPHIKRFRPKDRGRAHPILKRTSHITVGVEERA